MTFVHGYTPTNSISFSLVSVGYEYESCLDLILWEKRTAVLQGYELDASNMGGWTLDKHHILDVQNGRTLSLSLSLSLCPSVSLPVIRYRVVMYAWQ